MFEARNGYRFAALPDPGEGLIWLDVRYPVGQADDPPDKPGLAHLVEHLLFDVELDRGDRKTSIDAELRRITLVHNAVTTEDDTTYTALLTPDHLDEVIQLERERIEVGCAGLTPEIFERERAVVVREIALNAPDAIKIDRLIRSIAYPQGHPYRTSDTPASVAKLELADACAMLAGAYQRGTAFVVASGAVEQAQLAHAAHAFDRLPARIAGDRPQVAAATITSAVSHHPLQLQQARLLALWALPPRDALASRSLSMIMNELPRFINQAHAGYAARIQITAGKYAPMLKLSLLLADEDESPAAIEAVKAAVAKLQGMLASTKLTDPEWKQIWQSEAGHVLADWDAPESRNRLFTDYLQLERGTDYLADRLGELQRAAPAHVAGPVSALLSTTHARWLVLEASPGRRAGNPPPASPIALDVRTPSIDATTADQPLAMPHLPPPIHARRLRLASGLSVLLWPYGTTPVVRGTIIVGTGWQTDLRGRPSLAGLIGAEQGIQVTPEHLIIEAAPQMVSHSDRLVEELGKVLQLRLSDGNGRKRFKLLERDPAPHRSETELDRDRRIALYGARHPYARPPIAHESPTENTAWIDRNLVASNATVIVTGQFDPEVVAEQLARLPDSPDPVDKDPGAYLDETSHPTQTWIAEYGEWLASLRLEVAFAGGHGIDSDHVKRLVLAEVLSEKLHELRERTALSYVTQASYLPRPAGGVWSISVVVDENRAAEAGTAFAQLLDQMRHDPESYRSAFVLARQRVMDRMLASSGSASQALVQLVELARFDLLDDLVDRRPRDVASLTLTAFHAFVAHELAEAGQVFCASGKAKAVDAALAAARQPETR